MIGAWLILGACIGATSKIWDDPPSSRSALMKPAADASSVATAVRGWKRFVSSSRTNTPPAMGALNAVASPAAAPAATSIRRSYPVSYTHLRAHETDSYLVCRLLL